MVRLLDRLNPYNSSSKAGRTRSGLFVDGGMVPCPIQGDISLEFCMSCEHLRSVEGDPVRRIECRPHQGAMSIVAAQPIE
jgi:hypothetical protein